MDVGDHTTTSDGSLDQGVELLITSNGQLQVSWGNSLHLQVLGSVTSELQDLSSQVLEDGSAVDSRCCSNSAVGADSALQESMNSSDGELYSKKELIFLHHQKRFMHGEGHAFAVTSPARPQLPTRQHRSFWRSGALNFDLELT